MVTAVDNTGTYQQRGQQLGNGVMLPFAGIAFDVQSLQLKKLGGGLSGHGLSFTINGTVCRFVTQWFSPRCSVHSQVNHDDAELKRWSQAHEQSTQDSRPPSSGVLSELVTQ
ncbi:hypothetical protein AB1N83_013947 [Pleurotus pulmonarius]